MNRTNTITISGRFVTGCDPALLGNDTQATQSMSLCGTTHTSLGIKNGFVCYSGTDTGSNAFYYCFDCGYNTIKKSVDSFIRTCKPNGKWDGAIPHCDCSHMTSSKVGILVIAGFMALLLLLLGLIITFISIIIFLIKIKVKLMVELKTEKDKNMLYDIVGVNPIQIPQTGVDTADNIAYTSCT